MKLKEMSQEEIELLSLTEIAYLILKEEEKNLNTPTLFREVSKLLGYTEEEYTSKIGNFYTSLTLDKRFVPLENGEWDLRDRRKVEIVLDDEEIEEEIEEFDDEETILEEEEIEEVIEDNLDDEDEDDLKDLSIISEIEEEEA